MIIEDEAKYQLLLRQFPLRIEATERVYKTRTCLFDKRVLLLFSSYHFHVRYHIVNQYQIYFWK
jgi:hypothetical protein